MFFTYHTVTSSSVFSYNSSGLGRKKAAYSHLRIDPTMPHL